VTRLDRLFNIDDMEARAVRRLPRPIYDVVAGGAADEITLRANRDRLAAIQLQPRVLVDVARRDLSTTVLGHHVSMPVMLAPVGFQRMLHRDAELASARAAASRGTVFACNTISTFALEDVAAASSGPKWFQLYLPGDRSEAEELVARVERSGYPVMCLTVDTAVPGLRERDRRHRVTQPLTIGPAMVLSAVRRPRWSIDFLAGGVGRNPAQLPMTIDEAGREVAKTARPVTVEDLEWLRARWKGSLVVKGILRAEDCRKVLDCGADGVVVSNHGGRQLDSARATIDALPEVVDAVAGKAEVFVDGGFRRGTDVAKALALGARAVLIGKAFLYGLAVGGQSGVERVLDIFRSELDVALGLLGCASVHDLDRSFVVGDSVSG
jgi:isopentenyl diphosphate isomerase/L-lactate dehydrogenase-like FMN-dependent dehydrogenase